MTHSTTKIPLTQANSWQMFDAISRRYDFLNRFLSFGLDRGWREKIDQYFPPHPGLKILDLATGTADVLITLVQKNKNIIQAHGIDLADNMLAIGQRKIDRLGLNEKVRLSKADAQQTGFPENHFDCVTISFGIRNVANPISCLKEMYRITKPGGKAVILEFSLPPNLLWRWLHLFYLRAVVPVLGGLISGHFQAYRYLNRTIEQFPSGVMFGRMMQQVGFCNITPHLLLGGVATIYAGDRP